MDSIALEAREQGLQASTSSYQLVDTDSGQRLSLRQLGDSVEVEAQNVAFQLAHHEPTSHHLV